MVAMIVEEFSKWEGNISVLEKFIHCWRWFDDKFVLLALF